MSNLAPVDTTRVTDVLDALIAEDDPLELVLAMIPTQFGISAWRCIPRITSSG